MKLINLPFIAQEAEKNENENIAFRSFLKHKDGEKVDKIILPIAKAFTDKIDCTQCGNCCKNIMISVEQNEVEKLATALNMETNICKQKYFESSDESDKIIINAIPCHFLSENKCTVYENRPSACASFPHLHLPHFTSRLYSMLDGYAYCPIIYHSMEALKKHYNFQY